MTSRSAVPDAPPTPGPGPIERLQARLRVVERRVRRIPLVRAVQSVLDTYNAAGGGITASGLAYGALFAVIPGLLLVVSVLVIVVDNQTSRDQVIAWLIEQLPPLEPFAQQIVASFADTARVGSVLGLVGFIWGASGFYLALEGAMERLFPGPRRRDPIMGRVRGVVAVLLLVAGVLAVFVASSVLAVLPTGVVEGLDALAAIGGPVVSVVAAGLVAWVVYVIVPSDTPGWRAAFLPATVAGVGIGLLTSLFGLVSQLLVGGLAALGAALVSVFAALVWFNWVFQFLLYGGAWARLRRDRRMARGVAR